MTMPHTRKHNETSAEQQYPGAAVNAADKNKVSEKLEKERTCTLNNNPRNTEIGDSAKN